MPGVLCHHRAMTMIAPAMMTASTPRAPTRTGRFPGRAATGLAGGRRDGAGRGAGSRRCPGYASAPAWRAGPERLATLVTRTSW
jgi:hypothetical protein